MNDFIEVIDDNGIRKLILTDTIEQVTDCEKNGCLLYLGSGNEISVKTSYNDIKKQLVWEEVK